ncbi:MAG: response regulator [Rhodospirillaceae bacterium]|jgi:CheY-like chemotaxis protein|nr:response regulator [Rhodospirillaceae bacterium]MBT4940815.1 response regulator [Rhodospirillaceae bacterium]MBT5938292.1 response regulator [Rhodospirillaceae bacterium]MBT7265256.1 response regulator [Rhodospirillaceae bacterium]
MTATDKIDDQIDSEFIEEAIDTLSTLEITANSMRGSSGSKTEAVSSLQDQCAALQKLSHWANQPLIDLAVRRLIEYILDLDAPTDRQLDDIDAFIDVLRGILEDDIEKTTDQAEFIRSLPVRRPVDLDDLSHLDIEILLVDPQRSSARIFSRELVSCGYRVTTCQRSFEALELSVRIKPDMVIASAMLDDISGVELGCSLAAMESTALIPFAILTSFNKSHASLKNLPVNSCVLKKGDSFGDDIADALEKFGIA